MMFLQLVNLLIKNVDWRNIMNQKISLATAYRQLKSPNIKTRERALQIIRAAKRQVTAK